MIDNVKVTSVSYRQFCNRVRKQCDGFTPTREHLYMEWNKCPNREGSINYAWHAANLKKKAKP
jgi:hypothetical protein